MDYDVAAVRSRFPALARTDGRGPVAYLDGPGGTQAPETVIEAMATTLRDGVSNLGGPFASSTAAESIVTEARTAAADLVGADPDEIAFGQNMTSLTFAVSRAIGRDLTDGDRIVVTALDHAANNDPWRAAAGQRGASVHEIPFDPDGGILSPSAVAAAIDEHTRVVAVTAASNALGSVTDLGPIVAAAHEAGAIVYVDAVHFTAHRIPDVRDNGIDFLVASGYKFFGPHVGLIYGRRDHLERFEPFKVRPAPDTGPGRWETGTQSFESLAGLTAAVDHIASLGEGGDRRSRLESAYAAIGRHEHGLITRFLDGIESMSHIRLHGPRDEDRVATFALSVAERAPSEVAALLGEQGIYVWSGDYYAHRVMEELGLAERGGAVRIGFVHYTSPEEVDRVLDALDRLA